MQTLSLKTRPHVSQLKSTTSCASFLLFSFFPGLQPIKNMETVSLNLGNGLDSFPSSQTITKNPFISSHCSRRSLSNNALLTLDLVMLIFSFFFFYGTAFTAFIYTHSVSLFFFGLVLKIEYFRFVMLLFTGCLMNALGFVVSSSSML